MAVTLATAGSSSTGSGILSSLGVGSGINVNSLITQLMAAEQGPLQLLQSQQSSAQAQISAFGSLSSSLSSLQAAAQALEKTSSSSVFSAMTATPADSSVISATAAAGAAAGTYNITVTTLASSQIVRSNSTYGSTDTFNAGTLAITVGGTTTQVTIGAANDTLAGIASSINASNAGVTATVLNDGTTNRLVLSSNTSGTAGAITVAGTDSGTGATHSLADFNYSGTDTAGMVQSQAAQNASFTLNGTPITRSSNTVGDVIQGVSFNLLAANSSTTLTVAQDSSGASSAINTFVTAYNAAVKALGSVSAYDASTNTAQPLTGNPVVINLQSELPKVLASSMSGIQGGLTSLADIGVTLAQDGTLNVDPTKLASALAKPGNDVASLLGGGTGAASGLGYATRIDQLLNSFVGPTGAIASQTSGLNNQVQELTNEENVQNQYLAQVQQIYTAEFNNMDTTIAKLQSTSSYLTQQLQYMMYSNIPQTLR